MAIKNFQFPGVELTQEFAANVVQEESSLGVVVIGKHYKTHMAGRSEEAKTETDYTALSGATILIPGRDSELTLDTNVKTQKLFVYNGAFNYYTADPSAQNTDYVWTTYSNNHSATWSAIAAQQVIEWSAVDKDYVPAVKVFEDCIKISFGKPITGSDLLISVAKFGTRGVQVGDPVCVEKGGVRYSSYITKIESTDDTTGYDTIVIPKSEQMTNIADGDTVTVHFCISMEEVCFNATETNPDTGALATIFSVEDDTLDIKPGLFTTVDLGTVQPLATLENGLYEFAFQYRELNTEFVNKPGSTTLTDIPDILGFPCLDNPLSLGVTMAAAAAPNRVIHFIAIEDETPSGYTDAMDIMSKYEDVWSVVPLTDNKEIIKACIKMAESQSENSESKIRRVVWCGIDGEEGLKAAQQVVKLVEKKEERAKSYRARVVFADHAVFNGEDVPNCFVAAAAAGLREYEPAHRPLSNLGYNFFEVKEDTGLTPSQLRTLGSHGIWIIANNSDGVPINKRQVTSAEANNLLLDEDSIVANADEIALTLCHIGEDLVGCSNISPSLIMALSDTITIKMNEKTVNRTGSIYIGPQLISWNLDSIYQDEVRRDHIYANITCEPPRPFNRFVMHLRIV